MEQYSITTAKRARNSLLVRRKPVVYEIALKQNYIRKVNGRIWELIPKQNVRQLPGTCLPCKNAAFSSVQI